jgi:hypothetical protein
MCVSRLLAPSCLRDFPNVMDFLFLDKHARIYGEDILHLNQVLQESNPSRARACSVCVCVCVCIYLSLCLSIYRALSHTHAQSSSLAPLTLPQSL